MSNSAWQRLRASKRKELAIQVANRDNWICWICKQPISDQPLTPSERLSVDHLVPQSRGGTNDITNLAAAHQGCNSRRGNRITQKVRYTADNTHRFF